MLATLRFVERRQKCRGQTYLVSYEGETTDSYQEDDEGDEIREGAHDCSDPACGGCRVGGAAS